MAVAARDIEEWLDMAKLTDGFDGVEHAGDRHVNDDSIF